MSLTVQSDPGDGSLEAPPEVVPHPPEPGRLGVEVAGCDLACNAQADDGRGVQILWNSGFPSASFQRSASA